MFICFVNANLIQLPTYTNSRGSRYERSIYRYLNHSFHRDILGKTKEPTAESNILRQLPYPQGRLLNYHQRPHHVSPTLNCPTKCLRYSIYIVLEIIPLTTVISSVEDVPKKQWVNLHPSHYWLLQSSVNILTGIKEQDNDTLFKTITSKITHMRNIIFDNGFWSRYNGLYLNANLGLFFPLHEKCWSCWH